MEKLRKLKYDISFADYMIDKITAALKTASIANSVMYKKLWKTHRTNLQHHTHQYVALLTARGCKMVDRGGKLKQDLHRFRPTGEAQIPMALHGEGSAAAGAEAESPSTDGLPEPSLEGNGAPSNVEDVLVDAEPAAGLNAGLTPRPPEAESPSTDDSPEPSLESDGDASNVEGVLVDVRSMVLLMVKLSKAYAEKQADLDDYSDLFDGCLNKGA